MTKSLMSWVVVGVIALGVGCKKKEEAPSAPVQPEAAAAEAATPGAPDRPTGAIATVNGTTIDAALFNREMDKITQGGARTIPEDRLAKIRENILNRLIEEELLAEAIRKEGIEVTPEELATEFAKYKARFKGEDQFQNYLKHGKTTVDEIQNRLTASLSLTKLLVKLGKLEVTEEDVRKTYETGIKMYTEPEQVHALHVLVKAAENAPAEKIDEAKAKAGEALAKLKKGADFAAVVAEYSEDVMSKEKGGDLGFFRRGVMVPKFEEAAFALKPGQMTQELVRTPFGFHIIKVLDRKAERVRPLDEVAEQIRESLKNRATFKARRELVQALKASAQIERNP